MQLADSVRSPQSHDRLLHVGVEAIKALALRHPRVGYRKLSYMMLGQNIVGVSDGAVFRTLHGADLVNRWKRSTPSPGVYNFKQQTLNQVFCRYIVHHRLLTELSGTAVTVELETALASCTLI